MNIVPPDRRPDALGVFALALLARGAVVLWAQGRFPAAEDGHYYDVLARRLASGAGYTWLWPDGAVTYVAHYPVGYPALLALGYVLFGASGRVAMTLSAVLGAASAYAAHRLVDGPAIPRWRPLAAGLVVALHPALVPYTAAFMTEGVTASLLVVALAAVTRARNTDDRDLDDTGGARRRRRAWRWMGCAGVLLGIAVLVRPQSLILVPIFGALAVRAEERSPRRVLAAAAVMASALLCVTPWTLRNCARMHSCALVSVNGGWNLLIGAKTTTGAWQPMPVPPECATVWDEGAKDACFGRAARRDIARDPAAWLARVPAKLAATFDYFGAAPWYLHASNPQAFGEDEKARLGAAETIAGRLLLLGALVACARLEGRRRLARRVVALTGAAMALTLHGWLGYLALAAVVALAGWRALVRAPSVVPATAAVIAATAGIHAVFFGAGRYGLVAAPFVAVVAFVRGSRDEVALAGSPVHIAAVDAARAVAGCASAQREESPSSTGHDAG